MSYSLKANEGGEGGSHISLSPSEAFIPAHEHRYVTLTFEPKSIGNFLSTLEATVDKGLDSQTRQFTCSVRGEGTLPHVVVEGTKLPSGGAGQITMPTVLFPRLHQGRQAQRTVTMRNTGLIPAKFRYELQGHTDQSAFHLAASSLSQGHWIELEPKQSVSLGVEFCPQEPAQFSQSIKFEVHKNPFDSMTRQGEATPSLLFENLPEGSDEETDSGHRPRRRARGPRCDPTPRKRSSSSFLKSTHCCLRGGGPEGELRPHLRPLGGPPGAEREEGRCPQVCTPGGHRAGRARRRSRSFRDQVCRRAGRCAKPGKLGHCPPRRGEARARARDGLTRGRLHRAQGLCGRG